MRGVGRAAAGGMGWVGTALALALAAPLAAAPVSTGSVWEAPAADVGLRVYLVTIEPGEAVWERFGHNALWIHDPAAGTDIAYHYGLFDMSEAGFLLRFLQGRMFYSMGADPAVPMLEAYRRMGRHSVIQELRLAPDQARDLQAFLEWNMRPENRVYRYDYFRDNCSTRIRDALDRALGGALRAELESRPSPVTYREEALSLTAGDPLLTAGMDLGLGPLADHAMTEWELAFIPMRLEQQLRTLTVERDGRSVAMVASEHRYPPVGPADQPLSAPPERAARRVPWMLAVGLLLGAGFAGLGWFAARETAPGALRPASWALAAAGSAWGLAAGVLGLVLLGLWLLTDHEFAHANENLFQANPLALGLIALVPLAALRRDRTRGGLDGAFWLAAGLLGLSALGLLLWPLPLTPQATLGIIALALPAHAGLVMALHLLRHTPWRPAGDR